MRLPALAGAALLAVPAAAHISFAEPQVAAGSYHAAFLRVGHGCDGSPTVSLRVEIPTGVEVARPQPKPGWTLTVEHGPPDPPGLAERGGAATRRVTAIVWTGLLAADAFDRFGLLLELPAQPGVLFFPTVQRCVVGSNAWVNRPATPDAWHATAMPAPMLIVTAGPPPAAVAPVRMDHGGVPRR